MQEEIPDQQTESEDSQTLKALRSGFKDLYDRKKKGSLPEYEFDYYLIQKANENSLKLDEYKPLFRAYCIEQEGKALKGKVMYLFFWTERRLEELNHFFSEMDAFQFVEYVLKVVAIGSIALGLLSFFLEGAKREEQRSIEAERKEIESEQKEISQRQSLYQAWQTLTAAQGKSSNAGRREALGVLMNANVNLEGLNLENSIISNLNLAGANLPSAQLKNLKAYLINLKGSKLSGSDLRGANLGGGNLRSAEMEGDLLCPSPIDPIEQDLSEVGDHCHIEKASITKASANKPSNRQSVTLNSNRLAVGGLKSSPSKVHEPTNSKIQKISKIQKTSVLASAKEDITQKESDFASDTPKKSIADKKCPWSEEKYSYTNLTRADLQDAKLAGADLSCATLKGTNLSRANLVGANLSFADSRGAILFGTIFGKKDKAMLEGAKFKGALYNQKTQFPDGFDKVGAGAVKLEAGGEVNFPNLKNPIDLTDANLSDADLRRMRFINVVLEKAVLDGSNLTETTFSGILGPPLKIMRMGNAKFRGANLNQAKFVHINLEGADFSGARLEGANLEQATICKANFRGAVYVKGAISDISTTKFPKHTLCSGKPIPGEEFVPSEVGAYEISDLKQRGNLLIAAVEWVRCLNPMQKDGGLGESGGMKAKENSCKKPVDLVLEGSNLSGLDFKNVDWENSNLKQANLRGADLSGANLSKADLRGADLTCLEEDEGKMKKDEGKKCTNLAGANLTGVDLSNAKLDGADLSDAELSYAILDGASLKDTKLDGVSIRYTNFKDADPTAEQVRSAKSIDKAKYKSDLLRKLRCHHALEWLFKACIVSPD